MNFKNHVKARWQGKPADDLGGNAVAAMPDAEKVRRLTFLVMQMASLQCHFSCTATAFSFQANPNQHNSYPAAYHRTAPKHSFTTSLSISLDHHVPCPGANQGTDHVVDAERAAAGARSAQRGADHHQWARLPRPLAGQSAADRAAMFSYHTRALQMHSNLLRTVRFVYIGGSCMVSAGPPAGAVSATGLRGCGGCEWRAAHCQLHLQAVSSM